VPSPKGLLKLFDYGVDPRFGKLVSEQEKMRSLLFRTEPTADQIDNLVDIRELEGRPWISSMADRTQARERVTDINNVSLLRPVELVGGQNYMGLNPGRLWANEKKEATAINKFGDHLQNKYGQAPVLLPWRMTPTGGDSSTMTGEVLLGYLQSALGKKDKAEVNKYIKNNFVSDWAGLDDPRHIEQFRQLPSAVRSNLSNQLGSATNSDKFGGLSIAEARAIVTEPYQYDLRDMRLQNVGLMDPKKEVLPSSHPGYESDFQGEPLGRLAQEDITPFDLLPSQKAKSNFAEYSRDVDRNNLNNTDFRSLTFNVVGGVIDDKVLKNLEKLGVLSVGVAAGSASAQTPEFLDRIYNPQNHQFIVNSDGSISTHRMAAEQSSSGNWYVFPTIQEMPDGTLKEFLLPDGTPDNETAMRYAIATNNIIQMKDKDSAIAYAEGSYKNGTPLESFNPMSLQDEDYMNARLNNNYAEVREAPRGPITGMLADAFMGAKDYLNEMPSVAEFFKEAFGSGFGAEIAGAQGRAPTSENVNVPLGDIMFGESPEAINQLSYGLTPSAEQGLDLALTAGGGLAGAAKGVIKAGKSLGPKFLEMSEDLARNTGTLRDVAPPGPRTISSNTNLLQDDLGFYSAVEQTAMNMKRNKGSGQDFLGEIRNTKGVKEDEIKWMGLDEFLESKDKVTKQEVLDYVARNKLNVDEVVLGDAPEYVLDDIINSEELKYLKAYPETTKILRKILKKFNNRGPINDQTMFENLRRSFLDSDAEYEIIKAAAEDAGYKYDIDEYLDNIKTSLMFDGSPRNYQTPVDSVISDFADNLDRTLYNKGILHNVDGTFYSDKPELNLPKGENGREILLRYPVVDPDDAFSSENHWMEYGEGTNIFAHLRVNDRTDADGKKMLFIEELQSDWHQTGKQFGYENPDSWWMGGAGTNESGDIPYVPDAPMKNTWHETALRRAVRFAAENGYERIGITPSKVQIARNPTSKESGMKLNYDQKYPKYLSKYGKKWGARSGKTSINIGRQSPYDAKEGNNVDIFYLDITPEMRRGVIEKGQPLFSAAPFVTSGLLADDKQDQNNFGLLN